MSEINIPRRMDTLRYTTEERVIHHAIALLEMVPADPRLTDAVVLLGAAKTRVADYVDGVKGYRTTAAQIPEPVESPSPIAGKADEMPDEVAISIGQARKNLADFPGMAIENWSGNAIRWLADDRERLLARLEERCSTVDKAHKVLDTFDVSHEEGDTLEDRITLLHEQLTSDLDKALREREELATILRTAGVSYVRDGEVVV